ncbi:MAG: ABC transporter permease [Bacteroidia bacterium]|nr:ABC transporter permease [Bacteroidia bacterium]
MLTPRQIAWKKFRSNIPAVVGSVYFLLVIVVALLGYVISPDNTSNANLQILELAKKPPGTSAWVLAVPLSNDSVKTEKKGWVFTGKRPSYRPVPLADTSSFRLDGERILYRGIAGAEDRISLSAFGLTTKTFHRETFIRRFVLHPYYFLGTDTYGRDLFSRIILGGRVSLAIGLMAVLISLVMGILLGTFAGYFGGWLDQVIMWLVSVMWAIPTLLLALAISFVLGKGFWQLFVAIGVSIWVEVARVVRGQILSVREMQFAEAARAMGFSDMRVMFRHIFPNVLSPIIVMAVSNFGAAVLIESGLSFLGIGVEVPVPTWGRMIYEGYTYIVFENGKWLAFFPGLALILLVVAINLIGIGLRDALDVKL